MSKWHPITAGAALAILLGLTLASADRSDSLAGSYRRVRPGVPRQCTQIAHQNPEYKRCKREAKNR